MEISENIVVNDTISAASTKRSNPWGKTPSVVPCSLAAVMDEEVAKELQAQEDYLAGYHLQSSAASSQETFEAGTSPDTENDYLLAQLIQFEYDKEYDHSIDSMEKRINGESKVSVSFDNFRSVHPVLKDSDSSSSDSDEVDNQGPESACNVQPKPAPSQSPGKKKEIITKHDPIVCGRRNVKIMEKFPPRFAAGNVGSSELDLKLPNSVFNTLKQHSYREEKHAARLHEKKEHATHEQVLDPKTRLVLYKLVNGETLEAVNGCISTGKEACVFHAYGGRREEKLMPEECAVKVFKTTLNEFKTRDRYIKDDHRFRDRFGKQNPRKIIRLWAEKEMCNLSRMQKAGIPCPTVALLKKHILIMSFIGKDQKPAPKLKDAVLSSHQLQQAYQQCVEIMCTMYKQCKLVHADLSEYNILWHNDKVWFIDVSQSVEPFHPHALEFLYRDCTNVVQFFTKCGVYGVVSAQELFNKVTELGITPGTDRDFLSQIQTYQGHEMTVGGRKNEGLYDFDYFFNKGQA
ncbi:serine/threonine-protein kinase RIO3-like [Montipora capricornis]|uniref:serine/threonine-protein kinase RIO3-like n=1 Tax=Montipora capricornis TaxID=246305 RepID=UPI0035F14141